MKKNTSVDHYRLKDADKPGQLLVLPSLFQGLMFPLFQSLEWRS